MMLRQPQLIVQPFAGIERCGYNPGISWRWADDGPNQPDANPLDGEDENSPHRDQQLNLLGSYGGKAPTFVSYPSRRERHRRPGGRSTVILKLIEHLHRTVPRVVV